MEINKTLPTRSQKILIVDDEQTNLDILMSLLSSDYRVVAATSGEGALKLARKSPPDLILLDVLMPGTGGYEVCETLKSDPLTREIPVIFITALSDLRDEQFGLESGAIDYVTKPFSPSILSARVRNQLELKRYRDHLEEMVAQRTAELEQANLELVEARDAAEEASRVKSVFLRSVSHELRTPLNGIIAATSMWQDEELDEDMAETLDLIQISGDALLHQVESVLSFARSVDGEFRLDPELFRLREVLAGLRCSFVFKGARRDLALTWAIDEAVPDHLFGSRNGLSEILGHLLNNAAKFNQGEPAATLRVTVEQTRDSAVLLRFELEDNGIGIEPELHQRIFEPFFQKDDSDLRPYDGLGIGLSICKHLVGHMNGELGVESDGSNGSRFWFTVHFDQNPTDAGGST